MPRDDVPSSFLALPAQLTLPTLDASRWQTPPELPAGGARYEVEQLLGRGGMARVYRAFDRQLERRVALKLLDRATPAFVEPFLREARAQARVRHDNVLEVYETGELGGRPYIAMRYVEGPTLLALGELPLEARLRLLAEVAEGLHAAHRAGLLHRDVKPSNVLVEVMPDGGLKPYVADFGIATALETAATLGAAARGPLAGTPLYMAPEQLRGETAIDRRSDVYSLGATACQLLTGALPAAGRQLSELLAQLPPDVAAIVRKCLAKEPAERYPSARAVAADLRRFLDGEVVEAHAATLAYRLTKLALRHRTPLTVTGVAALLLTGALFTAAILGVAAMRANERAEARRAQAEDLIGFMLGDLRAKLEPASRLALLDDVGNKALEYFAAVPRQELSPAELSRRARALYQIGDVRIRQGDLEGAKVPLAESLALAEELVRRDPHTAEPLFELGQSYFWVGYVDWKQGELAAAGRRFEAYLEVSRRLVAMVPESPDFRLELHYATSNLGSLHESRGDLAAAIAAFREALATIASLAASDPTRTDWQFELAAAHNALAVPLQAVGRYDEAHEHYLADLELRRRLAAADPANRRWREFLGTSHTYMTIALLPLGRLLEARAHALEAVRVLEALVAEDGDHAVRRFKLAAAHLQLGRAELALGELAAAGAAFRRQAEILAALVAHDVSNDQWRQHLALACYHLGLVLAQDDPGAARAEAERALRVFETPAARAGDRRPRRWMASALLLLGRLDAAAGRDEPARRELERALALLEPEARGAQDLELAATWLRAVCLLGRQEEARDVARELLARGYRESGFADPVALAPRLAELAR